MGCPVNISFAILHTSLDLIFIYCRLINTNSNTNTNTTTLQVCGCKVDLTAHGVHLLQIPYRSAAVKLISLHMVFTYCRYRTDLLL
jgi:hypothetical protein